jgi:hypothetical protein
LVLGSCNAISCISVASTSSCSSSVESSAELPHSDTAPKSTAGGTGGMTSKRRLPCIVLGLLFSSHSPEEVGHFSLLVTSCLSLQLLHSDLPRSDLARSIENATECLLERLLLARGAASRPSPIPFARPPRNPFEMTATTATTGKARLRHSTVKAMVKQALSTFRLLGRNLRAKLATPG